MTLIGWLLAMILIGFAALVGMRLVPVYIEGSTVRTVVKGLESDPELSANNRAGVVQALMKRFDINNVTNVSREDIALQQVSEGLEVVVEYDARVTLFGNLDAVAHFRQQAVIRR
jgi:hypothetical protein